MDGLGRLQAEPRGFGYGVCGRTKRARQTGQAKRCRALSQPARGKRGRGLVRKWGDSDGSDGYGPQISIENAEAQAAIRRTKRPPITAKRAIGLASVTSYSWCSARPHRGCAGVGLSTSTLALPCSLFPASEGDSVPNCLLRTLLQTMARVVPRRVNPACHRYAWEGAS